jgi:DNA polymerase IV (archaeal DinB-like DNA polymerase)
MEGGGSTHEEDHILLSNEKTLESSTRIKEFILKFLLKEPVEELYERLAEQGYVYKSVAIKTVKSDFSIEFREISFSKYQNKEEGITSVLEGLLKIPIEGRGCCGKEGWYKDFKTD